jgi:DNA repair exonuclease SbcCD nuclease subunit
VGKSSPNGRRRAADRAGLVIVHSSDLHVDDGSTAEAHGGDGTAGLRAVLRTAQDLAADLVLLAGDIFEHNRLPMALLDRTTRLLGDAGRPVVILPGNHDPALPESPWRRGGVSDPENVHVLGVTHDEAVLFAEFELEIWGHAHRDYDDMFPLRRPRRRTTRWQIATAHGHYDPKPDLSTDMRAAWLISDIELAATGADYVALGHWNRPVKVGRGVPAYYSGSPELAKTVNVVKLAYGGPAGVRRVPIRWA